MNKQKAITIAAGTLLSTACVIVLLASGPTLGDWQKTNLPPDVDKADHQHGTKPTCWMAAASNMLAGAGYGDGNNVQQRADDIYTELIAHYGPNNTGWADTALTWWLQSNNNTWKSTNPYTVVNNYGNRDPRVPWANPTLPEFIGDELRQCNMLRLSIRIPTCDANDGTGGHAITAWGDDGADANNISENPNDVKVSDSDYWNISENIQTYTYDDYNNPNPDGQDCNEGPGWYIDYKQSNSWYIDGVVTLSPGDINNPQTQTLVGSVQTTFNSSDGNATGLQYTISSDNNDILSYSTRIDWGTDLNEPNITEQDANVLRVIWDLNKDPAPDGTTVTITAEIVVPYDANGNSVSITQILFTPLNLTPSVGSLMMGAHPGLGGGPDLTTENICGGYVICSCPIYEDSGGSVQVGEHRFQLEYDFYLDPEEHHCVYEPEAGSTYFVGNFRFGHSYGLLTDDELWQFSDWMTYESTIYPMSGSIPPFHLYWTDQLPYPQGQDYTNPQPAECGDPGTWYVDGDINRDCRVDFKDFAAFASTWLQCTDPQDPNCF